MSTLPVITALALSLLASALPATEPVPPPEARDPMIEPRWYEGSNHLSATQRIDLDPERGEKLIVRYCPIGDSGVEVEFFRDDIIVWRKHVRPLGIEHSKQHKVAVTLDPKDPSIVRIISVGAQTIEESRSLKDGRQLSRVVRDNQQ